MLFRTKDLEAIVAGKRSLAFRRWKRPAARAGGTVNTQLGLVGIDSVEAIDAGHVTESEAKEAGYPNVAALHAMFDAQEGTCYRIRLHFAGPDTRKTLAGSAQLSDEDRAAIDKKLARLDARSPTGSWTAATLDIIARRPGVVSTKLAEELGRERFDFKNDVRKLKALGLTISLDIGYRISPRGAAYLKR